MDSIIRKGSSWIGTVEETGVHHLRHLVKVVARVEVEGQQLTERLEYLTRGELQRAGAMVGDKVEIGYRSTSSHGWWVVEAVLPAPLVGKLELLPGGRFAPVEAQGDRVAEGFE